MQTRQITYISHFTFFSLNLCQVQDMTHSLTCFYLPLPIAARNSMSGVAHSYILGFGLEP